MPSVHFWRIFAPLVGTVYAVFAFIAGLHDNRFWMDLDCLIAALYYFGGAKSHSLVKAEQRRRRLR